MSINTNMEVAFVDGFSSGIDTSLMASFLGDHTEKLKETHSDLVNDLVPYVNMKIEKFSPRIKELKFKNKYGKLDSGAREHLNNKISRMEETLNDPNVKMVTDIFNKGFPIVPFPSIERCLGMGIKDSVVHIKDGYAIMGYDFKVKKTHADCMFNMNESVKSKELTTLQKFMQSRKESGDIMSEVMSGSFQNIVDKFSTQMAKQSVIPDLDIKELGKKFDKDRKEMLVEAW